MYIIIQLANLHNHMGVTVTWPCSKVMQQQTLNFELSLDRSLSVSAVCLDQYCYQCFPKYNNKHLEFSRPGTKAALPSVGSGLSKQTMGGFPFGFGIGDGS